MNKKMALLLGAGYVLGMGLALRAKRKAEGKPAGCEEIRKDFFQIHRELLEEAETQVFSEENKARFDELKTKLLEEADEWKNDAEKRFNLLMDRTNLKKDEIIDEVRSLYARREELIVDAKKRGLDLAKEAKDEVESMIDSVESKGEKALTEIRENFRKFYQEARNKIKNS